MTSTAGYDQGWRNDKHVRTTADVNGDTMQDLVGFGDHDVWISLSNGTGFDAPKFVIDNFALHAGGWQVSRHPRVMADVNHDNMDDIVGFGNAGVWISHSNGNSFDAPYYAVGDFGYNQGGESARIRSSRTMDQPPPDGPDAPSNAKITEETTTSISLAWNDNSNDERRFLIYFDENPSTGNTRLAVRPENSTSAVIKDLTPDTEYCFKVHAENIFGVSAGSNRVCGRTKPEPVPTPTPTPSPSGIKEIQVFNCNLDNRAVYVWTFDLTQAFGLTMA